MMKTDPRSALTSALAKAQETLNADIGGPFGAAILGPDGALVAVASNSVLGDHDPTAHAEINALREAGRVLKTHDLSGCTLVTTCYPCPMCLSAIVWSNIREVYYGATAKDAAAIGFRDDFIYDSFKEEAFDPGLIRLVPLDRERCLPLFEEYKHQQKQLY